jgi:hypothetical protein
MKITVHIQASEGQNNLNFKRKSSSRRKLLTKENLYSSQPFLISTDVQKLGTYHRTNIRPKIKTIDTEINQIVGLIETGNAAKRSASREKKRKRPKSFKKRKPFNFLDNYVTEKYNQYKRQESENHLIKMKLYKEIGMPPLPLSGKVNSVTEDNRQPPTQDTSPIEVPQK